MLQDDGEAARGWGETVHWHMGRLRSRGRWRRTTTGSYASDVGRLNRLREAGDEVGVARYALLKHREEPETQTPCARQSRKILRHYIYYILLSIRVWTWSSHYDPRSVNIVNTCEYSTC